MEVEFVAPKVFKVVLNSGAVKYMYAGEFKQVYESYPNVTSIECLGECTSLI